ncbi:hypothetical protein N0V85_004362 [Neurospora sp. IMI 360204]|nr:hypothetical protein N0V85_004362 [Neurospora sp. IMI 360204]
MVDATQLYRNENSAELGWSQEQSLLDAVRTVGPINVFMPDSDFLSRAGPAFTFAGSWLDDPSQRAKGKELRELSDGSYRGVLDKVITQQDPLPTYWCSRFQSQSFWDSHVAVYGLGALKAEPLVRSNERYYNTAHLRVYHARRHVQPSLLRHQPIVPNQMQRFRLEGEQTFQYMEFRRKLWKSLRPWYKQSYRIWQKTPYSFMRLRRMIDEFRQAVLQRNRKDAEAIVGNYSSYLKVLALDLSEPYFDPNAPPGTKPYMFFDFDSHPALWPFCILEVMMHASLPYDWLISMRKNAAPPPSAPTATTSKEAFPNRWFPSQHALAAGTFFQYPPFWSRDKDEPPKNAGLARPDVTDPGRIVPPMIKMSLARPDSGPSWPSPAEHGSLWVARWVMLLGIEWPRITNSMRKYPISKRLMQALIDQYKRLLGHHSTLGPKKSNGQWLDFDFEFPPYDENDEFVVLDRFIRPMTCEGFVTRGGTTKDWFEKGHAHPDKLTVDTKPAQPPADAPEVYLPSEDEGDGDAPEVWQRWWPVHPYVDVDVDMMNALP